MEFYTNSKNYKKKRFIILIVIVILIISLVNFIFYLFNRRVYPAILELSKSKVTACATSSINETAIDLFNEEFDYDQMIIIDRDKDNNINMIRTNTVKLNYLSSRLSIECNKKLQEMGKVGINVPITWMTENKAFYNLGPKVNIKVEPVGEMSVDYESEFESAGINQTRHTIKLICKSKIKIIMPLKNEEIEVVSEIPVAETIIVGKIPDTSINLK